MLPGASATLYPGFASRWAPCTLDDLSEQYCLPLVEDAPIPRHERTWRHPSELSAPPVAYVEPSVRGRQLTALAVGAIVAIGVVGILATFAPTAGAPTAVSSTTTPPILSLTPPADTTPIGRSEVLPHPHVTPLRATFDPTPVIAETEPRPFEKVLVVSDVEMFYVTWRNLQRHGGPADSIVVNMHGQVVAHCDHMHVTVVAGVGFTD